MNPQFSVIIDKTPADENEILTVAAVAAIESAGCSVMRVESPRDAISLDAAP
jgi:hypothetical protein